MRIFNSLIKFIILLQELIKIGAQGQSLSNDGNCDWEEEELVNYEPVLQEDTRLRPVVIDGSNVAMRYLLFILFWSCTQRKQD